MLRVSLVASEPIPIPESITNHLVKLERKETDGGYRYVIETEKVSREMCDKMVEDLGDVFDNSQVTLITAYGGIYPTGVRLAEVVSQYWWKTNKNTLMSIVG